MFEETVPENNTTSSDSKNTNSARTEAENNLINLLEILSEEYILSLL